MKPTFLALLVLLATGVFAQSFEGTVTYRMDVKNPMPDRVPDSLFYASIGNLGSITQVYRYKGNNYRSDIKETEAVQLYDPKKKRLYSYKEGGDTTMWSDATKYMDELVEIRPLDETETILGVECKAVMVKSKFAQTTYYYSDKYKMDPKRFEGHTYGLWEDYLKETGALPLKFVVVSPFTNVVSTAVDIKEEQLADEFFELPKFKQVIKNPF